MGLAFIVGRRPAPRRLVFVAVLREYVAGDDDPTVPIADEPTPDSTTNDNSFSTPPSSSHPANASPSDRPVDPRRGALTRRTATAIAHCEAPYTSTR